jgi:6-phospho-beta-glucosidase
VLSVPNNGSIAGFADDDVVEISCEITQDGANPVTIGEVPEDMFLLMKNVKLFERLTVDAVKHKSRELAIQALKVHPLVNSYSIAKQLVHDYLHAYQPIMGQWK